MTVNIIRLPATPDRRPVNPDCIPAELQARPQWVGWDVTTIVTGKGRNRTERQTKTPIDVKRGSARADVTDPADHNPFDAVLANSQRFKFYGIGFVFTAKDPYIGIDLDKCRNPDTGVIEPWALAIVEAFGTYTEPSPSETGLHLIARGIIPGDRNRAGKIEMYDRARFFTMTGDPLDGYEQITDCQDALDTFYAETFPAPAPASPRPAITLTMDDHDLIAKVRAARNGAKFDRLYSGDSGDCGGDASAGDLAFVSMLTFYNPDDAQIDRIVRQSGRYREKWERADYRASTIAKARQRTTFYETSRPASATCRDMTPATAAGPEGHTPSANPYHDANYLATLPASVATCAAELSQLYEQQQRIAELEQALAAERDTRIAAEQRNQTLMQLINNATWTPAQIIAYARAQAEYDHKVARGDGPYGEWQDINLTELSKGVQKTDPETGEALYDADGTPKLQTSMTKKTISAGLKTVAATAGVIELRDRTDERGRTRLQMRALRPTSLETMRAHAEVFVQQDRARGRQKPKDPRLATITACPDCGPDADIVIKSYAVCAGCGTSLGDLPDDRIELPFQNETVTPPASVDAVLPTDVKTKRSTGRAGFRESRERYFDTDDVPDDPPFRFETVAQSPTDRCRGCGLRLFSPEEKDSGKHSYDCSIVRSAHVAAGGD